MIAHKWIGKVTAFLMALAVIIVCFSLARPSTTERSANSATEPTYVAAMDKTNILDLQIIADEAAWATMLENATAEEYIPATVVIDGLKIENVGIRPKGNSSLSMVAMDDATDRFSFKIKFDAYVKGQTWLGLDRLVVNNMQGDASYLKEYLSYDIMDYIGVDAPLYTFANLSLNGESWGFYLAVESLEESYAKRTYGNAYGNLYKPENMEMGGGAMPEMGEIRNQGEAPAADAVGDDSAENLPDGGQMPDRENLPNEGQMPDRENFPNGGQMPDQENFPNGGQMPDQENFPNGGESPNIDEFKDANSDNQPQRGDMGGMGNMGGNGVSLAYIDNDPTSYSAIFDNDIFDTTTSDEKRLIASLQQLSEGKNLAEIVDVDAVLRYFAAHTVVVNLDSYISNMGHNYYLYEHDGKLTMLPWDYNLAFGGFQSGSASDVVNFAIDTPVSGVSLEQRPILGKLLEVPAYLELYHSYLNEIVEGYFNSGKFEQTITDMDALIAPYVATDPSAFYDADAYQVAVAELTKLGLLRAESIAGQLDGSIPSTTETQQADPDKLVDASSVNLSALGSQGGGGDRTGGFGDMMGGDPQTMRQVMEIIVSAGDNELTAEQRAELEALGVSGEQITQFQAMGEGGFPQPGNRPGRPDDQQSNDPLATERPPALLVILVYVVLLGGALLFVLLFPRRKNHFR